MSHLQPAAVLNNHFLPQQQQQQQLHPGPQQPQAQPGQPALLQNGPNPNAPMALLGAPQNTYSAQLNVMQANNGLRGQYVPPGASPQGLNPPRGPAPPLVNGHNSVQGMNGFPNGMIPQQQIRRVASQPQGLNQSAGHIGGMPQSMGGMGGIGMNPAQNMPGHMRQVHQPQHSLNGMQRLQQPPQHPGMQTHMSPDMGMQINRQQHLPMTMNGGLPPHSSRTPSTQAPLMSGMNQPGSLTQQHSGGGMQPQMHQNPGFPSAMSMQHHNPQQQLGSSPHIGGHTQPHTAANMGANMPPSNMSPPQTDMFVSFQNGQMQPNVPQVPRLPQQNAQFSFQHSPTPPMQAGDLAQNVGGAQMNGPRPSSRPGLMSTPAQVSQVFEFGPNNENLPAPFNMHSNQQSAPARPPSHNANVSHPPFSLPPQSHQQGMPPRQSPRVPDQMNSHMGQVQRPQSQQGPPQRQSPQQAGSSRTPRVGQQPLPGMTQRISMVPPNQPGPPQQQPQPPQPQPSQNAQQHIAPRQPPGPAPLAPSMTNGQGPTAAGHQPDGQQQNPPQQHQLQQHTLQQQPQAAPNRQMMPPQMQFVVGLGQGTLRLLQFSGQLALETEAVGVIYHALNVSEPNPTIQTKDYRHWQDVIKDYFTHRAMMKITLWKDGQKQEAKPFEIGTPILPRFFLVTAQSGVKSMSIVLDNAREKTIAPGHGIIECPTASWIFRYSNGYTVALNGPLSAHVAAVPLMSPGQPPTPMSYVLRIEHLTFDATSHEKMVNVDRVGNLSIDGSPSHHALAMGPMGTKREEEEKRLDDVRRVSVAMPHEPVNAFGIPQATMRCLELAESVSQMSDLIHYSTEHQLGPRDALSHLARQIRDSQPRDVKPMTMSKPGPPPGPGGGCSTAGPGPGKQAGDASIISTVQLNTVGIRVYTGGSGDTGRAHYNPLDAERHAQAEGYSD
ncbi:predicted protein [Postia placenta Mad-698-R]|nr:predicted protein [Postia placenta Mad-698-R]